MSKCNSFSVYKVLLCSALQSARWKLVVLFFLLLFWTGISHVNRFCKAIGEPITPWLFPHMTSWMALQFTFMLGALLLLGDVPFMQTIDSDRVIERGHL